MPEEIERVKKLCAVNPNLLNDPVIGEKELMKIDSSSVWIRSNQYDQIRGGPVTTPLLSFKFRSFPRDF
mgnify:CR=1 FL=1